MPRHYHNETYHHQVRFIKRARRLVAVFAVILFITGAAIGIDALIQDQESSLPSDSTLASTVTYSPQIKIFRSPYFQFQADDSWSEVATRTSPDVYTYRSLRGSLIEHELTVYVNHPPEELKATYVLPVNTTSSGELLPIQVSEHCRNALPNQVITEPRMVIMDRVSFYCAADNTHYVVVVGRVDGDTNLQLKRPEGTLATYTIVYQNLTAVAESSQIYQIADSFQTR